MRKSLPLLAFLVVCTSAFAADEPYIAVPSGTTHALVLQENGSYSARLGVVTTNPKPSFDEIEFKVFEVQYKEGRSSGLARRFTPSKDPADKTHGNALIVTVPAGSDDLLPGNYVVTLHVAPASAPQKPQSLVFTFSKPGPVMSTGAPIYIERTAWFWESPHIVPGKLRLTEESRVANLAGLVLTSDGDRKPGVPAAEGKVEVPAGPFKLDAGKSQEYPVSVTGYFPPGTYTGKITARSPQLAAPVPVTYELLSRRHQGWLVILAAVGAALGFVVRVILKQRQELNGAFSDASRARQKLARARERIEEPEVREKIDEQVGALELAAEARKPAEIIAAAAAALTALQAIEAEFKVKWIAFEPQLGALDTLLGKQWMLPPAVQQRFDVVAVQREAVAAAFARNNVKMARELLQKAISQPLLQTVIEGMKWRHSFAAYLMSLEARRPPLSDDARLKLHAAVESARAHLPTDAHPTFADIATADGDLTHTHGAFAGGTEFLRALGTALADFLAQSRSKLAVGIAADSPNWDPIELATRDLQNNVMNAPHADLDTQAGPLASQLSALTDTWRVLLKSSVAPAKFQPIDALLVEGSWEAAVTATAEAFDADALTEEEVDLEAAVPREQVEESLGFRLPLANLAGFPMAHRPGVASARFTLTGSEDERAALRSSSVRSAFVQTLIVALIFIAGIYALNAGTWVGTPKEMLTIFLLAFGVDLTAEGVLAILKK